MRKILSLALTILCLTALFYSAIAEEDVVATRKAVYLTFDDGPKADTPQLLEILREENVPATFFFVGQKVRTFPEEARMVYEAGYAIGCHSVYHSYSTLKAGPDFVKGDYRKFIEIMREIVDPAFETDLYRFPGGSTSYRMNIRQAVVDSGCAWFDWNAMTSDTDADKTAEELYKYAVRTTADEEVVILLAHEGIKRTQRILPDLIAFYRDNGYEFRTLSTSAEDRLLYERCPANMMLPPVKAEETEETL